MIAMRKIVAILSLWFPAAVVLLNRLAWRDRLPVKLPTHWGGSGPGPFITQTNTKQFAINLDAPEEPPGILMHVVTAKTPSH